MNDSIKIISVFEYLSALRPKGLSTFQYESKYNWVYVVYGGSIHYSDDENELLLEPFHLYVLPAGKPFYLKDLPDCRLDHFCVLINSTPHISNFIDVNFSDNLFLKDMVSLINKYAKRKDTTSLVSLLECVLSYVLTEYVHNNNLSKQIKTFIDNKAPYFSIDSVLKEFHYSRRYLDLKFKKEYGFTIDKYGTEKQFAFVLECLEKNLSLKEICDSIGYSSPANLSRDFKKRFGVSPTKYRKYLSNKI